MNRRELLQAAIVAPLAAAVGMPKLPGVAADDDMPLRSIASISRQQLNEIKVTSIRVHQLEAGGRVWHWTPIYENQWELARVGCPE